MQSRTDKEVRDAQMLANNAEISNKQGDQKSEV